MTSEEARPGEVTAMRRALALAQKGPLSGGNPRVGCVLLAPDGGVLAEGWHQGAGTPHAEVAALAHVTAEQTRGATAVVTLEPCDHFGRTGPCTQALLDAGIARVVYASDDPGEESAHGAERLASRGVAVVAGVLAHEAEQLNHEWFTAMRRRRPWVIAKLAMSLDGRAAASDGTSRWITSPQSRAHAHEVRSTVDGIIVGIGTVLADDPSLTARYSDGTLRPHQPVPVVCGTAPLGGTEADAGKGTRPHHGLRPGARPGDRLRAAHDRVLHADVDLRALRDAPSDQARQALMPQLQNLFAGESSMRRVLVEGGPTTTSAFLRAGLVDELHAYIAPVLLGGSGLNVQNVGVETLAQAIHLTDSEMTHLGVDLLWHARIEGDGSLG